MTKVKEIDLVYELTRASSPFAKQLAIRELVKYLRFRGNYLDDALADLISIDGNSALQFKLGNRDGRRTLAENEVDRDTRAFEFVTELAGRAATKTVVHDIQKQIADTTCTIKLEGNAFVVRKNGVNRYRIPANKPISERCAAFIASLLPGATSHENIRTMVKNTRKAIEES
ncbi:hypothetical protein [Bradyrhizobium guangdongense]